MTKIQKIKMGVLAASVLAAIPFFASAQTKEIVDIDAQKNLLEVRADDIIDSVLFTPEVLNAEGKFEKLPVQQRYYYAGFPTDKTVVADADSYSSVEKTATGYKVYAADTFVYADGNWKTIENDVIEPSAFDAVMFDRVDPTLGDLLGGVFKAHAQTYYSGSDDSGIYSSSATWSNAHDATSGDLLGTNGYVYARDVGGTYYISRTFLNFDMTALTGSIESASLTITFDDGTQTGRRISVYEGSQANPITGDDFDACSTTNLSDDYVGDTASTPETLEFNSAGISFLQTEAVNPICLREQLYDVADSAPSDDNWAGILLSEASGTSDDPYLEITIGEEEPEATTTTEYASSTPGLTTTTATFFLFFAVVFVLGGLIILSWIRDIFA